MSPARRENSPRVRASTATNRLASRRKQCSTSGATGSGWLVPRARARSASEPAGRSGTSTRWGCGTLPSAASGPRRKEVRRGRHCAQRSSAESEEASRGVSYPPRGRRQAQKRVAVNRWPLTAAVHGGQPRAFSAVHVVSDRAPRP